MAENDQLEKYWSPTPVVGFKYYLQRERDVVESAVWFGGGPSIQLRLGELAEAECVNPWYCDGEPIPYSRHHFGMAPCGFYAYKLDVPSDRLWQTFREHWHSPHEVWSVVIVELHGTVLEHEYGYRASKLKVVDTSPIKVMPYPRLFFRSRVNRRFENVKRFVHEAKEYYYG